MKNNNKTALLDVINERISYFRNRKNKRFLKVRSVDYIIHLGAVLHDENSNNQTEMTEVSDVGPQLNTPEELKEAQTWFNQQNHIPAIWQHYLKTGKHPPFLFEKTSFVNLFSKDTIILFDIYRPPWKPYFTSDVFFYQWLKSLGKDIDLNNLPMYFPETMYVHNVTNVVSKFSYKTILDTEKTDRYVIEDILSSNWKKFRDTPHLKSVWRILQTYNEINTLRNGAVYTISSLQLYRKEEMYHLKFKVAREGAQLIN